MEVKNLSNVMGAWADKGVEEYARIAVKCEFDLSQVSPIVKRKCIKALRSGVLDSTQGKTATVFQVICGAFGLQYVCASRTGATLYVSFINHEFGKALTTLNKLVHSKKSRAYASLDVRTYGGFMRCWNWKASRCHHSAGPNDRRR